jgi:S1-C subfamily serine protease
MSAWRVGVLAGGLAACGAADDGPVVPGERVVAVRATGCSLVDDVATGFDLGDGLVMTAAHTLRDATGVAVDGRSTQVLVVDHRTDVALLSAATRRPPVTLASTGGDLGPATLLAPEGTRTVDVVRHARIRIDEPRDAATHERDGLVLDADVAAGESGSAVVDRAGRLVGMVFAVSRHEGGPAYAVAASELPPLIEQAASGEPVDLPRC